MVFISDGTALVAVGAENSWYQDFAHENDLGGIANPGHPEERSAERIRRKRLSSYISSGATLSIGTTPYTTGFTLTLGASSFTVTNHGQSHCGRNVRATEHEDAVDNAGRTVDALAYSRLRRIPSSPSATSPDFVGQEIQDTTTGTLQGRRRRLHTDGGRVDPIQQLLTNLIGVKPVGMSVTPLNGRTYMVRQKLTAHGDYDAVQLFYYTMTHRRPRCCKPSQR